MLTIVTDRGVKNRAMKVMRASGMTPTGVVRLMCSEGLVQRRIPFTLTREPSRAGIGMSESRAIECRLERDGTDGGTGERDDICLKLEPEEKQRIVLLARVLHEPQQPRGDVPRPDRLRAEGSAQVVSETELPPADSGNLHRLMHH